MLSKAASPDSSVESVVRLTADTGVFPSPALMSRFVPPRSTLWQSLVRVAFLIAETTTRTWPPVSPSFGLPGAIWSRPPNCAKPSPSRLVAVTVNGIPEIANCTPRAPWAVRIIRPAATAVAGTAITAARRRRTRPRLSAPSGLSEMEPLSDSSEGSGVEPADEVASEDEAIFCSQGHVSVRVGLQRHVVLARTAPTAYASSHLPAGARAFSLRSSNRDGSYPR